ncbi:SAM-dependent chlorinase/fluorinase [Oscillatoria sp. FACHB-1407]|uniref:SAM hydrolase/SAM-dependent halogenase family protein n=1 Tax=Oscillatoria sp. FACHB-1407 TaxID=2692847 RepID=UPI0016836E24|nr:SAM-dependent chlorinase/fluorinase [Oscillatoria sp. FACHB-1407]MBD2460386.1 SAM-dependent chlorinase/fluorinase [Oscillatoria sp. FACHB-1407]
MSVHSVLTLLTDFGDRDIYVGAMKGVIAQVNPNLTVIDLTHHIPPQDLAAARFNLMSAYSYFPESTVHVAVVDPGVGSERRAIALQLAHGFLVGPDNGIFSGVLEQSPAIAAVELTNPQYWRSASPSMTFHGRDIFAPVGAHLASGVPLETLGNRIDLATLVHLPINPVTQMGDRIQGCIQYIDHFGNLITNIPGSCIRGHIWSVQAGSCIIPGQQTYADVAESELLALVGSHSWIEIAVNRGNARSQLHFNIGDVVNVTITPASNVSLI